MKQIKYIIPIVIVLILLVIYFFFSPYEFSFFPTCPFYKYGGLHCAGCGSQRALHHLLHLEIGLMISNNLLLPFWLFLAGDYSYKKIFTEKEPLITRRRFPLAIFFIIIIYTILRNIPSEPFTSLAPIL